MYNKTLYVFDKQKQPVKITVRTYKAEDFEQLIDIQRECFPPPFPSELWWNQAQLRNHVFRFPEGALCVEVGGQLAGSITGLIVDFDPQHPDHTWADITDNGYIGNHKPDGDTLYIVDISVRPSYRGLSLGQCLMLAMYELVVHKRLKRLLGGGRMSGYHKVAAQMSAEEYLDAVVAGTLQDPVITFLMHCGRTPLHVVSGYLDDEESCNYAALMEWKNPFLS